MEKRIIIFLLLVLTSSANAGEREEWTTTSRSLYFLTVTSLALDGYSTHLALKDSTNHENNKILGSHPTDRQLVIYLSAISILFWCITDLVHDHYRKTIFIALTAVELNATRHNLVLTRHF